MNRLFPESAKWVELFEALNVLGKKATLLEGKVREAQEAVGQAERQEQQAQQWHATCLQVRNACNADLTSYRQRRTGHSSELSMLKHSIQILIDDTDIELALSALDETTIVTLTSSDEQKLRCSSHGQQILTSFYKYKKLQREATTLEYKIVELSVKVQHCEGKVRKAAVDLQQAGQVLLEKRRWLEKEKIRLDKALEEKERFIPLPGEDKETFLSRAGDDWQHLAIMASRCGLKGKWD